MSKKRYTEEEIITKLRQGEILLSQGHSIKQPLEHWEWPEVPLLNREQSMVVWKLIKLRP